MPLPAGLAVKLDPLIRRLATNHEGERLATVAALGRVLAAAKATFHDLAETVVAGTRGPEVIIVERQAPRRPADEVDALDMTGELLDRPDSLNDWEAKFVVGVRRQLLDGRQLSPKQRAHLLEIYQRELGS